MVFTLELFPTRGALVPSTRKLSLSILGRCSIVSPMFSNVLLLGISKCKCQFSCVLHSKAGCIFVGLCLIHVKKIVPELYGKIFIFYRGFSYFAGEAFEVLQITDPGTLVSISEERLL